MATLKYSRQRESIKEFLMTRTDHPTADVVYHHLRESFPSGRSGGDSENPYRRWRRPF